jgi:hypothetical protein
MEVRLMQMPPILLAHNADPGHKVILTGTTLADQVYFRRQQRLSSVQVSSQRSNQVIPKIRPPHFFPENLINGRSRRLTSQVPA